MDILGICCSNPKSQVDFYLLVICPKDPERIANNADPASSVAVWSRSTLFAYAFPFQCLWFLQKLYLEEIKISWGNCLLEGIFLLEHHIHRAF